MQGLTETMLRLITDRLPSRTIHTGGRPYLTRWYLWPRGPRTGEGQGMVEPFDRSDLRTFQALVEDDIEALKAKRADYTVRNMSGLLDKVRGHLSAAESAVDQAQFIHFFHRGDEDRDQHNHPWDDSESLILLGGYRELRGDVVTVYEPGMTNRIQRGDYHKVELLEPGKGCWSLFTAGRNVGDWGFLRDGTHVPWEQYISERDEALARAT